MMVAEYGRAALRTLILCVTLLLAPLVHADLVVDAGGNVSLGTGAMDLGCSDLTIAGSGALRLDSAAMTGVRNVTIQPGGLLDFGSTGTLALAGTFTNNGNLSGQRAGAIIAVNNNACAPFLSGPPLEIPTLEAGVLVFLALLLAGGGMFIVRRRIQPINKGKQTHGSRF